MPYYEVSVTCDFRGSQDILNNLDPPGTGELDDDDLMLDVDLPEDGLHGQHTHTHTTLYGIAVILHRI